MSRYDDDIARALAFEPQEAEAGREGVNRSTISRRRARDRERIDREVRACLAASPMFGPALASIGADAPVGLRVALCRILLRGIDTSLQRIRISGDEEEIATLAALCRISFDRLAEIRSELAPLLREPR